MAECSIAVLSGGSISIWEITIFSGTAESGFFPDASVLSACCPITRRSTWRCREGERHPSCEVRAVQLFRADLPAIMEEMNEILSR